MALSFIKEALSKAAESQQTGTIFSEPSAENPRFPRLEGDFVNPRLKELTSLETRSELSDGALYTRIESSAHSACKFFNLPDIVLQEGDSICVYRDLDVFPDKDVFEYNLDQFKQMGCTSFEDMTKIWAHECGHRLLRTERYSPWAQELGSDYLTGIRSEMLGLPSGKFEEFLAQTEGSLSHPPGHLRSQAIEYGRQVVKDLRASGVTPTFANCKAAFDASPFAQVVPERHRHSDMYSFVNSKSYHYDKAEKAQQNAEYYSKKAEKAANTGDFSKAKEYSQKAESYIKKTEEENAAAERSSKLVDDSSLANVETKLQTEDFLQSPKETSRTELTQEDRIRIKERTGWSDEIVNAIRTKEEAEIYENAGLVEGKIGGRPALLQPDLEGEAHNCTKWKDWSNKDLAGEGYAPYDKTGMPYELHHIGQNPDSPLAELTHEQHHKNGNFKKLHTFDDTKVHGDGNNWDDERASYWMERAKTM